MTHPVIHKRWHWPLALLAVGLLALALRWYYVTTAMVLDPVRGDATQYYAYAWNLANHGVFAKDSIGSTVLHPDSYRDPGYPVFLALWMKLLGTGEAWYGAVLLCQALLGALTVVLGTHLGKYWLPSRWAIASGVLMAVWPHSVTINGYLLTETLFGFLCVLGLLLFARSCTRGNVWLAGIAGLTLGAAALTNAVLLPFGVLLAGVLAWRKLAPGKLCLALLLGALLLPCGWAMRNTRISHPPPADSSMGRAMQNFVQGAWPGYHEAYRNSIFGDTAAQAKAQDTVRAVDDEMQLAANHPLVEIKAVAQRFGRHPWHYALWYLVEKPQELWGWSIVIGQGDIYVYPTANSPFQTNPAWMALAAVCHAINPLLMALALLGSLMACLGYRTTRLETDASHVAPISAACLLAFVTLVYSTLQAEPRYAIPFRSFECLLAVSACWQVALRVRQRIRQPPETTEPPQG